MKVTEWVDGADDWGDGDDNGGCEDDDNGNKAVVAPLLNKNLDSNVFHLERLRLASDSDNEVVPNIHSPSLSELR